MKFPISKNLFIILILLVAAFLRLYKISGYMTFLGDEGRDVLIVYNILHGNFTLLGPTASVGGFFLGPIYYYFMAPFLWLFNYSPVGPAVMVALFGVATVWLVYKTGSEFFDEKAGFFASALYAISPLVIAYSRSSWNPNLMPFFSLLAIYLVYQSVKKSSNKIFILSGILFGVLMQFHYLATFLGAVIAVYLFIIKIFSEQKNRVKIQGLLKEYFYFLVGSLIGWSPFLLFEVRHGFPNFRSILNFIFHSGETGTNIHFFASIWDVFFRLFGRLVTKFPPPEQVSVLVSKIDIDLFFVSFRTHVGYLYYPTLILALGSVVLFTHKYYKTIRDKESFQKFTILFLWLLIGVFLFGFYRKPVYDYYLSFMFPLPFLLVGNLFSTLYKKKGLSILSIIFFAVLVLLNLSGMPFRYPPNRQLEQVEKISRFVFDKTDGKPFNFALITGGNSDHAYRYFFTLWKHEPIVIQNTQVDPKRTSVTSQLLVVCEKNPCAPLGDPLWEVAGFGRAEIVGQWDVSVLKVYKLVHYKGG